MNRHRIVGLAAVALVALRLPTMASEQVKLYLPLVSRMPAPTPTPTIIPGHSSLSGRVFFDYNGSGLQEQEEPGIPGVLVHVDSVGSALHAVTAADGSYSIPNVPTGAHRLYIQSPTQDSATAFQYINVFKGWVNIAAYEINGVQVPAQHLPDTEIRPIDQPLSMLVSGTQRLDVALMQGFLTLPFVNGQVQEMPFIQNYSDIIGYRLFTATTDYFSTQDGVMLNYDGRYTSEGNLELGAPGVSDSHTGIDYLLPVGYYLVSTIPTAQVQYLYDHGELRVITAFRDASGLLNYADYGHVNAQLVEADQTIYRGQIIALSGDTEDPLRPPGLRSPPRLHYGYYTEVRVPSGVWYRDPYRYTVTLNPLPDGFWGSETSYWTKDNDPQFALVGVPILPTPTPTPTPAPTFRAPIVIDGLPDDWASAPPVLTDAQGDSSAGAETDLVGLYQAQNDTYVDLVVRTAGNLTQQPSLLSVDLDLLPGRICGRDKELTIFIGTNLLTQCPAGHSR